MRELEQRARKTHRISDRERSRDRLTLRKESNQRKVEEERPSKDWAEHVELEAKWAPKEDSLIERDVCCFRKEKGRWSALAYVRLMLRR